MSAAVRLMAFLRVRSPSLVIVIRPLGVGMTARGWRFRVLERVGLLFGWRVLHVSDNANNGANAGAFTFNGNNDSTNRNRNIGTRQAVGSQQTNPAPNGANMTTQ